MRLISPAFAAGGPVPRHFTCDGGNVSPPLIWSDPPAGTRSLALVCADPDAPRGTWYHWAIYDIAPGIRSLEEHWPRTGTVPPQAINDFHRSGYDGPCPPAGARAHHYHFKLYALNVDHLVAAARTHCRQIEQASEAHAIATAELIGVYGRAA